MNPSLDIFVVEDHPLNRQLVRDVLTHRGHRVREATSVAEALERLEEPAADIVLLDIQLGDGQGTEVLEAMRAHRTWKQVPIVAVTAFAMRGDRERVLALGFDNYISKPLDLNTFCSFVESNARSVIQETE